MKENVIKIYCDGGARGNPGPAAAAFVVEKNHRIIFKEGKFLGETTNNVAEYSAAILALKWLSENKNLQEKEIVFVHDSELIVKQINGIYKIKNENLRNRYFSVKNLEKEIKSKIVYTIVPRSKNTTADLLVNQILDENN